MNYGADILFKVLPHRYPFMMIDKIIEHTFEERAVCRKVITLGEEVFRGHFPGNPIYPGVLCIEMGLQATTIMMAPLEKIASATSAEEMPEAVQGIFLTVDKYKFLKPIRPGDILTVTSTLEARFGQMLKAKIEVVNDRGEVVGEGKVAAAGGMEI